jgi:hypothetical protein
MVPKIIRVDQLEYLLATLETHYKQLIASHRSPWRSAEDRESARQALARSATQVCQAVESLQGASVPELRQLVSKLVVQVEVAGDTGKNPTTLQR